jgi:subtilisin-like proprotein convertase family protein
MKQIIQRWCGALALVIAMGLSADTVAQADPDGGAFTVTASVGAGEGAIDPSSQTVTAGDPANFFVIAQPGWAIDSVSGDTCTPTDNGDGTWTASNITADCDVIAVFRADESSVTEVCSSPQAPIPDDAPAGIDDGLEVPAAGEIIGLRVRLQGQHTWVGDLVFELTHPNGSTAVTLVDRPGVPLNPFGCGFDDYDVWLDDGGSDGPVEGQCSQTPPALFGNAVPEQALSAFSGLATDGTWTLTASDNEGDDTGLLDTWCLELTYEPVQTPTFVVTPSSGPGGTITPEAPQTVDEGATAQFELRPQDGFGIDSVGGSCGGSLNGDVFMTDPVTANCTVAAAFALNQYTVGAQVGQGDGSIEPASQTVEHGQPATVAVTPDPGWRIEEVRGDTCAPADAGGGDWTAPDITADCQITVDFELITYTVTPTTFGGGGSIAPAVPQIVLPGAKVEFTLTPSKTQEIDEVTGSCGGNLNGNTFTTDPVAADCTVEGRFRTATFTVAAGVSGQGTIDPVSQVIEYGDSAGFTVSAADNWELDGVTGDTCAPVNIGGSSWQAENITADCQVTATFVAAGDAIFSDRFESSD